eukprot:TRINITY_DN21829_c0_g1_i1.p1 TRINITY_DN21829_c0_g1~~TRINITY_DN21829_c0_g1_i1.p1  ORF type:complete len:952 (+),score=210.82 TRINITY_DN21829_c0_g1_i1:60-2915(+)
MTIADFGRTDPRDESFRSDGVPPLGTEVAVHGLRSRAGFNGCRGQVVRHCKDGQHVEVHLADGEKLRIRPENLMPADACPPPTPSAASGGRLSRTPTSTTAPGTPSSRPGSAVGFPGAAGVAAAVPPLALSAMPLAAASDGAATLASHLVELQRVVARVQSAWKAGEAPRKQLRHALQQRDGKRQRLCLEELGRFETAVRDMGAWAADLDGFANVGGNVGSLASCGGSATVGGPLASPGGLGRSRSSTRLRMEVAGARDSTPRRGGSKENLPPGSPEASSTPLGRLASPAGSEATSIATPSRALATLTAATPTPNRKAEAEASSSAAQGEWRKTRRLLGNAGTLKLAMSPNGEAGSLFPEDLAVGLPHFTALADLTVDLRRVDDLSNLEDLGLGLGRCKALKALNLDLFACPELRSVDGLAAGLANLEVLEKLDLDLRQCRRLESVDLLGADLMRRGSSLLSLRLQFDGCTQLGGFAELARGLSRLASLRELNLGLGGCSRLGGGTPSQLGIGLKGLESLETLSLAMWGNEWPSGVEGLGEGLASLSKLTSLSLDLSQCGKLIGLAGLCGNIARLAGLQHLGLDLSKCAGLSSAADIGSCLSALRQLKTLSLKLGQCEELSCVDALGRAIKPMDKLTSVCVEIAGCGQVAHREAALLAKDLACLVANDVVLDLSSCPLVEEAWRRRIAGDEDLAELGRSLVKEEKAGNIKAHVASNGIVVLDEKLDEDYEPTQEELEEYAEWLGMDLKTERHLFWIARCGLKEPLPKAWKPCQHGEDLFYFNFETGESIWDHPCDSKYKAMYLEHKNASEDSHAMARVVAEAATGAALAKAAKDAEQSKRQEVLDLPEPFAAPASAVDDGSAATTLVEGAGASALEGGAETGDLAKPFTPASLPEAPQQTVASVPQSGSAAGGTPAAGAAASGSAGAGAARAARPGSAARARRFNVEFPKR